MPNFKEKVLDFTVLSLAHRHTKIGLEVHFVITVYNCLGCCQSE